MATDQPCDLGGYTGQERRESDRVLRTLELKVTSLSERVDAVTRWQEDFDKRRADLFVLEEVFNPVRAIAFAFLGLVAPGAIAALLNLVYVSPLGKH